MSRHLILSVFLAFGIISVQDVAESPDVIAFGGFDRIGSSEDPALYRAVYVTNLLEGWVRQVHITDYDQVNEIAFCPETGRTAILAIRVRYPGPESEVSAKIAIVDGLGSLLKELTGASGGIAWSPDGTELAYTRGRHVPDEGFASEGTFIYSLRTDESRQVYDKGSTLHWARFDGRLYIKRGGFDPDGVVVYAPATGEVEETGLKDVDFSPDGKYLSVGYDEGDHTQLIDRESGADVQGRYAFSKCGWARSRPVWLTPKMLVFKALKVQNYIVFLDTGKTLKATSPVIAVRGETVYLARPGLKIEAVPLDSLEVVFSEENGILKPEEQPATEQGAEQKQE